MVFCPNIKSFYFLQANSLTCVLNHDIPMLAQKKDYFLALSLKVGEGLRHGSHEQFVYFYFSLFYVCSRIAVCS